MNVTSGVSGIRDPEPRIPFRNATSVYVGIRKLSYSYKRTVIVAIQSLRYGTPVYILMTYCTRTLVRLTGGTRTSTSLRAGYSTSTCTVRVKSEYEYSYWYNILVYPAGLHIKRYISTYKIDTD